MNFDQNQINQLLNNIQYPISKSQLIQMGKQHGLSDQITGVLEQRLPDIQFNSAQDVQNVLNNIMGGLGSLGNLGNLGGGLKF